MMVVCACLGVFAISLLVRSAGRGRPLDGSEMKRIRRLAEKRQQEDWQRFE